MTSVTISVLFIVVAVLCSMLVVGAAPHPFVHYCVKKGACLCEDIFKKCTEAIGREKCFK